MHNLFPLHLLLEPLTIDFQDSLLYLSHFFLSVLKNYILRAFEYCSIYLRFIRYEYMGKHRNCNGKIKKINKLTFSMCPSDLGEL